MNTQLIRQFSLHVCPRRSAHRAIGALGSMLFVSLLLSGSAQAQAPALPGVPAAVEDFNSYPELSLAEAMRRGVEYSPRLKAQMSVVEQVKTNTTRAWALLLPTLTVAGSYTLTDQEVKLNLGSGMSDLYRLVAMNCAYWDTATMGALPSVCEAYGPGATPSTEASSSPTVIQERHNFAGSVTAAISLVNLRTWPNLANVSTAVELAELQQHYTEEQLVYAVVQLYYGIATAQESVRLMKETLLNALRHMEMVEARFKNGVALQNERVRQAMVVIQARNNLDQTVFALDLSRESLALMLGMENSQFRVAEGFGTPWDGRTGGVTVDDALANRKDLKILEKSTVIADRNIDDAWMSFFPVIQGSWTWSISSSKGFADSYDNWRAMISLSWSIFDGGYRFADLDERKAKLRELEFNRQQALLSAKQEIAQARMELAAATTALDAGQQTLALAEENLRIVERQYALGAAPQTTVTDAELQFTQARIQVVTAQLRLALARISLVKAAGQFYESQN